MRLHHIERIAIVCANLEAGIGQFFPNSNEAIHTRLTESRALALGVKKLINARCALVNGVEIIEFTEALADTVKVGLGWAGFESVEGAISPNVAILNSYDCALAAAFYLGLGAEATVVTADAYVVKLSTHASIKIITPKRTNVAENPSASFEPAMDLENPRVGILSVRIARIGTRSQSGPYRILRGLDGELIELG
jgi:hypothetical protein